MGYFLARWILTHLHVCVPAERPTISR